MTLRGLFNSVIDFPLTQLLVLIVVIVAAIWIAKWVLRQTGKLSK